MIFNNPLIILESKSNIDFLEFVIKWYSENEDNWLNEWEYIGCYRHPAQCVCGKEGLATVFIIRNKINKMVLSPIGSKCIKNFLKEIVPQSVLNNLKNGLLDFLNRNTIFFKRNIAVTSEFFTKENIKTFFNYKLINEDDLAICLAALNKRYATVDQYKKGASIIINKVIVPLKESLNKEINESKAPENSIYFSQELRDVMESIYTNLYKGKNLTVKESKNVINKLFPPNMLHNN